VLTRSETATRSDVDILVTFALNARLDAFAFAGIVRDLEGWVGARVDVAVRNRLKPEVRAEALRDEIRAF
jgi:predicted nucleotidyltransferase